MIEQALVGLLLLVTGCILGWNMGYKKGFVIGTLTSFSQWRMTIEFIAKKFSVDASDLAEESLIAVAKRIGMDPAVIRKMQAKFDTPDESTGGGTNGTN